VSQHKKKQLHKAHKLTKKKNTSIALLEKTDVIIKRDKPIHNLRDDTYNVYRMSHVARFSDSV